MKANLKKEQTSQICKTRNSGGATRPLFLGGLRPLEGAFGPHEGGFSPLRASRHLDLKTGAFGPSFQIFYARQTDRYGNL